MNIFLIISTIVLFLISFGIFFVLYRIYKSNKSMNSAFYSFLKNYNKFRDIFGDFLKKVDDFEKMKENMEEEVKRVVDSYKNGYEEYSVQLEQYLTFLNSINSEVLLDVVMVAELKEKTAYMSQFIEEEIKIVRELINGNEKK